MGINHVTLSGNLTRNAELKQTKSGTFVLLFSIAVNDRRREQTTSQWENYTNYFDCVVFGERGKAISKYMLKGTKVSLAGRLRYSAWMHDDKKHSKVNVIVTDIDFMSNAASNDRATPDIDTGGSTRDGEQPFQDNNAGQPFYDDIYGSKGNGEAAYDLEDEDIPF